MKDTMSDQFPQGELDVTARPQEEKITLSLPEQVFWQIEETDLTGRDHFLLSLFQEHSAPQQPLFNKT